jgi:large subunit ribosomal protein L9
MQVILLERVDSLGNLGDVVKVKPGYARNYLLPQQKALRATKDNLAYFETRKKEIEKQNSERKAEAAKLAKPLEGVTVTLLRHASEGGQLFGSVTSRDIAEAINADVKGAEITRGMVLMNQTYKSVGLFSATVALHAEVKIEVRVNIARTLDEAKIQLKTGRAVISDASGNPIGANEPAKEAFLEEGALEAEKAASEEEAAAAAEDAEKSAKKSKARAAKKAVKGDEAGEAEEESAGEE